MARNYSIRPRDEREYSFSAMLESLRQEAISSFRLYRTYRSKLDTMQDAGIDNTERLVMSTMMRLHNNNLTAMLRVLNDARGITGAYALVQSWQLDRMRARLDA